MTWPAPNREDCKGQGQWKSLVWVPGRGIVTVPSLPPEHWSSELKLAMKQMADRLNEQLFGAGT